MRARETAGAKPPTLVYLVGRVSQGVRRELRRRLEPFGLSVPELTALSVLQRRPGLSNAQLARRSMITPQSMNDVVAALERRGLMERRGDPAHRGILRARLTPAGRRLLRAVEPVVEGLQEEVLADVPEGEREVVVRALLSAMARLSGGD